MTYQFDPSESRIENAFEELYFALVAEREEDRSYVRREVHDQVKETIEDVYDIDDINQALNADDETLEETLDEIAKYQAAIYAQNTAENLSRLSEMDDLGFGITLEEFYDMDVQDRFNIAKELSDMWSWEEEPEIDPSSAS